MRYQIKVILTDGSVFYLEKINITKKEVKEIRDKYKIPNFLHDKAVFIAKLFSDYECKIMYDFLFKNDYIKSFQITKINPFILEDDVISYSKIARSSTEGSNYETISLGQINSMFVMGYGSIKDNFEKRKTERNYQGTIILLELADAEKSLQNIDKLQNYLLTVKNIKDISEFANKLLNAKQYEIEKNVNEFRKVLFPDKTSNEKPSESFDKIIKIPRDNWQN